MEQVLPDAVSNLMHLRGQIASMTTVRECRIHNGNAPVTKEASFICRIGVTYDNIKVVQEKRENGDLPRVNAGLSWGQWAVFPYVIYHNGEWYFRCTVVPGGFKNVTYYQNGREITRERAMDQCLASEFRRGRNNDVFVVKVSSIVEVNKEEVVAA